MPSHASFFDAMCVDFTPFASVLEIEDKRKNRKVPLTYIASPRVIAAAGRPKQQVVRFANNMPIRKVFGGAVVAVETETFGGKMARCYLPILDPKNRPIPFDKVDSRDITDTIMTGRRKSIAQALGYGLGVYCKLGSSAVYTNGVEFANAVGVAPDHDLATVDPKVGMAERRPYLEWPVALAAARITDPNFEWEVLEFQTIDENGEEGQQPYVRVPNGYVVTIRVTYKGIAHEESLAITRSEVRTKGDKQYTMHNVPVLADPQVDEWNTAVMRCLAKAIAIATGYGLSIYAKASIDELIAMSSAEGEQPQAGQPQGSQPQTPAADQAQPKADGQTESPVNAEREKLLGEIDALLKKTGTPKSAPLEFHQLESFEKAADDVLLRIHAQLSAKAKRLANQPRTGS